MKQFKMGSLLAVFLLVFLAMPLIAAEVSTINEIIDANNYNWESSAQVSFNPPIYSDGSTSLTPNNSVVISGQVNDLILINDFDITFSTLNLMKNSNIYNVNTLTPFVHDPVTGVSEFSYEISLNADVAIFEINKDALNIIVEENANPGTFTTDEVVNAHKVLRSLYVQDYVVVYGVADGITLGTTIGIDNDPIVINNSINTSVVGDGFLSVPYDGSGEFLYTWTNTGTNTINVSNISYLGDMPIGTMTTLYVNGNESNGELSIQDAIVNPGESVEIKLVLNGDSLEGYNFDVLEWDLEFSYEDTFFGGEQTELVNFEFYEASTTSSTDGSDTITSPNDEINTTTLTNTSSSNVLMQVALVMSGVLGAYVSYRKIA